MKILLVDDQAYNRDLLRFILEDEGHECLDADNGLSAVSAFEEFSDIDLILMDVNMPKMGGVEATEKISALKGDRFVTIIFVTAFDNPEVLVRCLSAGGDDFVPKPINESVLISKVAAHARNRDLYNNLHAAHQELQYHQQTMDRDHAIVEHVFDNASNRSSTYCQNLKTYTSSMSMFNGDVLLSAASESGGLYVLIGDFTGHGLSAAIGSLPVMSTFYGMVKGQVSVSELAAEINNQLHGLLPLGLFFCATILHLDHDGRRLSIWSGGMNDALLIAANSSEIVRIEGDHMPLGILSDDEFDERVQLHQMSQGDKVIVYTDGVNEAKNHEGEEFGDEAVIKLLEGEQEDYIPALVSSVKLFRGEGAVDDDMSIIELNCGPCIHRDVKTDEVIDIARSYHASHGFPWRLDIQLHSEDLKRSDAVHQVVSFLSSIEGVELHQDKLFTIISELYNNALEHGVLGLSSELKNSAEGFGEYYRQRTQRLEKLEDATIEISLEYVRGPTNQLHLMITDSGAGFDFAKKEMEIEGNEQSHGRGMHLLKTLCSKLEYSNEGRTVTAHYDFLQSWPLC